MARFRHPLKLKKVKKETLAKMLAANPQWRVAELLGVSQMTVSRRMRALGLAFDARAAANRSPAKIESQRVSIKAGYDTGKIKPYWLGREVPKELAMRRAEHARGKPAWNSGKKKIKITVCETCEDEFEHAPRRARRFCSRDCAAVHMAVQYSDGRFDGTKNPNFGNGAKVKTRWREGVYAARPLSDTSRGVGGRYHGKWLRSSWEIAFVKFLDAINLNWEYEPRRFTLKNGKQYTPDFHITDLDLWIEIKGYWWPKAKRKFAQFIAQFPGINIVVIEEEIWKRPQRDFVDFLLTKNVSPRLIKRFLKESFKPV